MGGKVNELMFLHFKIRIPFIEIETLFLFAVRDSSQKAHIIGTLQNLKSDIKFQTKQS